MNFYLLKWPELILFLAILFFTACSSTTENRDGSIRELPEITSELIQSENGDWGYCILVNEKKVIIQKTIPGLPGNKGFESKEDAAKVADLVIKKMKAHEMPAVSEEELKALGIEGL